MLQFVKRDDVRPVIQIRMYGSGNNQQFLIIALQFLECIFTEITGMGFFSMNEQHGAADFIGIRKNRSIDKSK